MPLLPAKRVREVKKRLLRLSDTVNLKIRVLNKDTGEYFDIGGLWNSLSAEYVDLEAKPYTTVKVHSRQWEFLYHVVDYTLNNDTLEEPIQDIILHGARRSGKSMALYVAILIVTIAKPASTVMIISLRKKHGKKIMGNLKKILPPSSWTYDKREDMLILANSSKIWSRSQVNYDEERGDSLELLVLDECAFMKEEVYEALSPSVIDRNGAILMASSPHALNWFYRRAEQAKSNDPKKAAAVRVVGMGIKHNTFLSKASIRRAEKAALLLSKDAYRQEIEGEFVSSNGQALPDFSKEIHIIDRSSYKFDDATAELTQFIFNIKANFIVGVDFNYSPTAGVIGKYDSNGAFYILDEVLTEGTTEKWASLLEAKLKELGAKDPKKETIIIADASGRWQGTGKNAASKRATWTILKSLGWVVFPPSPTSKANPRREDRLEVARALTLNMAGEIRLFVDKECEEVINCFVELDLKNGLPNLRSKHIHIWDGATYPMYRVWGTKAGASFFNKSIIGNKL